MKIVIGGGTGFIGRHLHFKLAQCGHHVTLISRTAGAGRLTWNDIASAGLPSDTGAVVNLAGELLMNPLKRFDDKFQSLLWSSRVDTTKTLASAIQQAATPPSVWVSTSAVGYYAPSETAEYTEESDGGERDVLGRLCDDWEAAARLNEHCPTRHVTARVGIALGRNGGVVKNMFLPFFFGLGGRLASGKQWFPWVHVEDVAGIIAHAIDNNHVTGVLNVVAPATNTNGEFTKAFASAMWRPAIFPVPSVVLSTVFGAERARAMVEGQKVIPKRTLESSYKFAYPDLKSACKECTVLVPTHLS